MVLLDPESDSVVIRVVYDGPPEAGKTTSVRALAGSLGRPVFTPGQVEGRTVYFDWLDYTGGLFEGHRIRCQVVSVPGQATLAPRRRALLLTADVVVFVADSRREALDALPGYLQGLSGILAGVPGPPVGLVVQANKRDLAGAAPVAEVRRVLDASGLRVGIVESIAVDAAGVREGFVFAVRLALDRAREQLRTGRLARSRPEVGSGEELLAALQQAERGALDLAASDGLRHIHLSEVGAASPAGQALSEAVAAEQAAEHEVGRVWHAQEEERPPRLPGAGVAGGMIWPPVHGRLLLHETEEAPPPLSRNADGDWYGLSGTCWRVQSPAHAAFTELEGGRAALIDWARVHSASAAALSPERCIVLGEDHGGWRLWQVVRAEESVEERLLAAEGRDPGAAAQALVDCVNSFGDAVRLFPRAACRLPLTLAGLGAGHAPARFVGLMPAPAFVRPPEPCPPAMADALLARALGPHLERLSVERDRIMAAMERMPAHGPHGAGPAVAVMRRLWATT